MSTKSSTVRSRTKANPGQRCAHVIDHDTQCIREARFIIQEVTHLPSGENDRHRELSCAGIHVAPVTGRIYNG